MSEQQVETKEYFQSVAEEWREKAQLTSFQTPNVITQRNNYVIRRLKERDNPSAFLDIGCGTGELAVEAASLGVSAEGIDFADQMIEIARSNLPDDVENCSFYADDFFKHSFESGKYDLISANGLIEYISLEQLNKLLDNAYEYLKDGGVLVLGSRNRLFNVFALNEYTELEMESGNISALLHEAIALNAVKHPEELNDIARNNQSASTQSFRHPITGIEVSTRYQYTPLELTRLAIQHGFKAYSIMPIHYHAVPPTVKEAFGNIYSMSALVVDTEGEDCLPLVPQASSFMIGLIKQ